ncbi:hypothetical protein BGZ83_008518 [Gryganskiella cystojenkinii]|nr:hypothetical protein BGZ83_008518 [Gryganskiella cystojenkinii]
MTPLSQALQYSNPANLNDDRNLSIEWDSPCWAFQATPELYRHNEPSPEVDKDRALNDNTTAPATTTKIRPMSFAFQQHAMYPHFPFRGRNQSIFLTIPDRPTSTGYRCVSDFLRNNAIQRIHGWFRDTIEPKALEHGRNLSLMDSLTIMHGTLDGDGGHESRAVGAEGQDQGDSCPVCFQNGSKTILKAIGNCFHKICWKCEQDLNRAGNVSCPMCRGIRLIALFDRPLDIFKTTIGLVPRDYIHPLHFDSSLSQSMTPSFSFAAQPFDRWSFDLQKDPLGYAAAMQRLAEKEHKLSDRYLWEKSATFLENLQVAEWSSLSSLESFMPLHQYFQVNAALDLCFRPRNEQHNLLEYSDYTVIEPPTSGLVLPPSRLYIALIHFCLDMLTVPNDREFQTRREFRKERLVLELVVFFLVPTTPYSPRGPERIHDVNAWIENGQCILARLHQFMWDKIRLNKRELLSNGSVSNTGSDRGSIQDDREDGSVPSTPIPRSILYLGAERWTWISQSLMNLISWLQTANSNPLKMMAESLRGQGRQSERGLSAAGLGNNKKRASSTRPSAAEDDPRPTKRARRRRCQYSTTLYTEQE